MTRQHLQVLGVVCVVIIFVVLPLAKFMRGSTVVSIEPIPFRLNAGVFSSPVDEYLLDDMRLVAYVVDDTWSFIGYPIPFEELKITLGTRIKVPLYEATKTSLRTFGLYYRVSFDGQLVTIEAYGIEGQRIGLVTGARQVNYGLLPGANVSL